MENDNVQMIKNNPPIVRQLAGAAFGIFFAVTGGYKGLEFVLALLFSPVLFAGIVRIVIGLYRFFLKYTPKKVYDEFGACVIQIPRKGLSAILACIGFACVISVVASSFQISTFVGVLVTCMLVALEIYTFLKDIRTKK